MTVKHENERLINECMYSMFWLVDQVPYLDRSAESVSKSLDNHHEVT